MIEFTENDKHNEHEGDKGEEPSSFGRHLLVTFVVNLEGDRGASSPEELEFEYAAT